ncbi:amidase [soil metagenome]
MNSDLVSLTAVDLLGGYRAGDFTPTEVTAAILDRIDALEPQLNAFYRVERDYAESTAAASTERYRSGTATGLIDGVPLTVKENIATVGTPLTGGTAAGRDNPPATVDGPTAALAAGAGGVRLGKTTMPDYGMLSSGVSSLHGITRSPFDNSLTVGGSSAGAGASAAARLGPLHIGSDIGGSLRLPAGWLGLATLKPSFGLVPVDPPFMGRCIGPIARTVDDVALAMSVLAQPDSRDFTQVGRTDLDWSLVSDRPLDDTDISRLRIGVHVEAGAGLETTPDVAEAVLAAAKIFERAGASVEVIRSFLTPELLDGFDTFFSARSRNDIVNLSPEKRAVVLPFILDWALGGDEPTGVDILAAYQSLQTLRATTIAATAPYDIVLSPVAPVAAFPAEWPMPSNDPRRSMHHIAYTMPYNFSEQPAASVNCGFTADGRTIGLQLAGGRFEDVAVLQVTKWFEANRGVDATPVWPL